VDGTPHVAVHNNRLPGAPDQAAAEEGNQQENAVVQLWLRAGHIKLVEEPMNVEEGCRQLVEDEDGRVVVQVGPLKMGG